MQHFILQIPTVSDRGIQGTSKDTDIWCVEVRDWAIPLQHRLSVQQWVDCINMWSNAVLTFNHSLGVYIVLLGYNWIPRNVYKNIFNNLNILQR